MIHDILQALLFEVYEKFSTNFTEFQKNILHSLLIILLCNIVLTIFYWNRYGSTISRHFIKSSTLIEIEDLRKSVEKLKLPKEHTPRI